MKKLGYALYAVADSWGEIDFFFGKHTWEVRYVSDQSVFHRPNFENVCVMSGVAFQPEPKTFVDALIVAERNLSSKTRYADFVDEQEIQITPVTLAQAFPD